MSLVFKLTCFLLENSQDNNAVRIGLLLIFSQATSQWSAGPFAGAGIPKIKNDIPGLTSIRVKTLLNSLAKFSGSYLEIGSYLGATAYAVLQHNTINAYFVDNWAQEIQPQRTDITLPPTDKEQFLTNIEKYKSDSQITVFDCDLFEVPTNMLSNVIQLFFYDGPHDEKTTAEAVQYYWSCLQNEAIMVFDDANWEGVVAGANKGIEAMNGQITYKKLMLNTEENANEWWNGLYIVIVRKT